MTNTLNYACLGIIAESLEFLETVRSKPFSEENILQGGDVLFYAMLLQYHHPHLDIDWFPDGLSLEDTNDFILKTARFAKFHSHYIRVHGRKGSDVYDKACTDYINMVFTHIAYYSRMGLIGVAKKIMEKLQRRHFFFNFSSFYYG